MVAVFAFPLRLRNDRIGSLNLYRDTPGYFQDEDVRLAQAFADVAVIGILQERKVSAAELRSAQLQHAFDNRLLIEQAKGMLAERTHITPNEAFDAMRTFARGHNQNVRHVCQRVIDTGFIPD